MKYRSHFRSWLTAGALTILAGTPVAMGLTISWSNEVFDQLIDSYGNPLDDSFYFQLGFFDNIFTPNAGNVDEWSSHWNVFDQASFNPDLGYFTSEADIDHDGYSTSDFASLGINFSGQEAYVWARNGESPISGTQWFLGRSESWVFPTMEPDPSEDCGCCDTTLPLQWSLTDLANADTPAWGGQKGIAGLGEVGSVVSAASLQTFTFVPEPAISLLVLVAGFLASIRRRRHDA